VNNNENHYLMHHLLRKHLRSYKYALKGLISIFLQQLNFQLELIITILVIVGAFFFQITKTETVIVVFAISIVLIAEALNSAIEAICDVVQKEIDPDIRHAKDVGAGGVLIAVIGAGIAGCIVFLPYVFEMIEDFIQVLK